LGLFKRLTIPTSPYQPRCCNRRGFAVPGGRILGPHKPSSGPRAAGANPMIFGLFRPTPANRIIASLYGMIVAQARAPAFYQIYRVPDTVGGRFEMVLLHAVLVLQRLEQGGDPWRRIGQGVFDRFCRDMDESMREMGVGDLAVPRKMRRIG